ncbi:MAG TPA: DUF6371 domain-containing protein [Bacteroidia bacterium]|nr:DUF6371 domain-containing protein [Bacteroidia bacterium]
MNEYRYILEPYKGMNTRYYCPDCQQRNKTFTRYIDTETGEHINFNVGRCERSVNCGYHYTPKQYFQDNNISFDTPQPKQFKKSTKSDTLKKAVSFIPVDVFKKSLQLHNENNFVKFFSDLFGTEILNRLIEKYFIGTSKFWNGATVFWQIDKQGKIRAGKIILYDAVIGKRVKKPFDHINWVHSVLKQTDFELKQCLFGEHLLIDKTKPVAIVESEKTAVIASVYLPKFIWVAVGSLTNLNAEKCSILKGRTVTLFPDLNGFEKWSKKAKELSHIATFTVSDLLERKATEAEKKQGLDLADYLIKFNYKEFVQSENRTKPNIKKFTAVQPLVEEKHFEPIEKTCYFNKTEKAKSESWEQDITELENYFASIELPTQPVKLNKCSTITDCAKFIESHFATVKGNNGNRIFLPHLNRLQELKTILQ